MSVLQRQFGCLRRQRSTILSQLCTIGVGAGVDWINEVTVDVAFSKSVEASQS